MAAANRQQMAGLMEQTDRMTGAAGAQVDLLHAQTERMAEAARQPIVPFRVPVDLAALASPREESGPKPVNPVALAEYEERQRQLREQAEIQRLQGEQEQHARNEAELKLLLAEQDRRNRDALELRQLLLEKERIEALKQFISEK
jgi:hypothetical protein